uniref:Uncharacterized protein n=1 Tax=Anguilla anguilla TaxID=7936 RepID=A0A0E9P7H5_ANGAN
MQRCLQSAVLFFFIETPVDFRGQEVAM